MQSSYSTFFIDCLSVHVMRYFQVASAAVRVHQLNTYLPLTWSSLFLRSPDCTGTVLVSDSLVEMVTTSQRHNPHGGGDINE